MSISLALCFVRYLAKKVSLYRVVQLDFTPEIEVFCVLYDRSHPILTITPPKQHTKCFNVFEV